jgi:hypothetical protein
MVQILSIARHTCIGGFLTSVVLDTGNGFEIAQAKWPDRAAGYGRARHVIDSEEVPLAKSTVRPQSRTL